jgi:hypothetical protein
LRTTQSKDLRLFLPLPVFGRHPDPELVEEEGSRTAFAVALQAFAVILTLSFSKGNALIFAVILTLSLSKGKDPEALDSPPPLEPFSTCFQSCSCSRSPISDAQYCTGGGKPLLMDVFLPKNRIALQPRQSSGSTAGM